MHTLLAGESRGACCRGILERRRAMRARVGGVGTFLIGGAPPSHQSCWKPTEAEFVSSRHPRMAARGADTGNLPMRAEAEEG